MITLDKSELLTEVFHRLKSRFNDADPLSPKTLEQIVCKSFGLANIGEKNQWADGVKGDIMASVKTIKLDPKIYKKGKNKVKNCDFATNPDKFLGIHQTKNKKTKKIRYENGPKLTQRRQEVESINDGEAPADEVGRKTIEGVQKHIDQSHKKTNTKRAVEIITVHGRGVDGTYKVGVYWDDYQLPDPGSLIWTRGKTCVEGTEKKTFANGAPPYGNVVKDVIVCERVNGNAKRQSTCFNQFTDPTKYKYSEIISVPIPEQWPYDKSAILSEINNLKGSKNATVLLNQQHQHIQQ
jgi:hypothetical protein